MNKISCTSQNTETKTLPAGVCIVGFFERLSPAAVHSADHWFDSGVKWWIYAASIVTYLCKNSFLLCWNSCKQCSESLTHFWSTVSQRSTHFEYSFLIGKCSCKILNTLPSNIFNSSTIPRNFNLRSAKTSLWSFPEQLPNLCDLNIIYVCTTAFKVSIAPLNCCFRRSRVQITLIKPLLCLNRIFSHQKAMLCQHMKFRFFHFLKICNSSFTWITVICELIIR